MKKITIFVVAIAMTMLTISGCSKKKEETPQTQPGQTEQVQVPKNQKTIDNLKAAIKGETTANAKYTAFAKKASEEGYTKIAKLFEAIAHAESIHINNHKEVLANITKEPYVITPDSFTVGTTEENLADAIKGETYESTTMYPEFLEQAKTDNEQGAVTSFDYALQTEKKHKQMYENALQMLKDKKEKTMVSTYYICPKCGYTYLPNELTASCIVCATPKEKFIVFK
ncbi:MAG TPA: rubrerythrin family protein [Candidatus Kapabacteria bacterium]|nr:rubrerythrin family protein [Candidatus Kapabacteria bacterium]HRT68123.1 rubrerythrin family protein [Bacteroidota bacterium]